MARHPPSSDGRGATSAARPAGVPARGHQVMRARRVQGTTGSHPVSGTAKSGPSKAAQGTPRPGRYGIGVRTTRRRTAFRIPLPPDIENPPERCPAHGPVDRATGRARPPPDVPWFTVRCARGPPAGAIGQGRSLVLQRSYVKGVLQAYVRAVNAVSPICQIVRAANDKSTVAADAGRLTGRSAQPASPRGSARLPRPSRRRRRHRRGRPP